MKKNTSRIELLFRLSIVCISLFITIYSGKYIDLNQFIVLILILLLNTQIRIVFLKDRPFLMSLMLDIAITSLAAYSFNSLNCILYLIPLLHAMLYLQSEAYLLPIIIAFPSIYFLKSLSIEFAALYILLFVLTILSFNKIRKLISEVNQVEFLYDQNRKYSYELEGAKKRLEEYSKAIEQMSQLEERNNISREIHDTVGHRLTGVLMQLEASIRMLEVEPEKGNELLLSSRNNLRDCMDLLRQTVRTMKPKEYKSRILSINDMLNDFSKTSGVAIDFNISGNPVKLSPGVEITIYKNIQEAVTNAVKHGQAKKINVMLHYSDCEVISKVEDDGKGCKHLKYGMGISGMEERASIQGGKIVIENVSGFSIQTIIPLNQIY